MKKVLKFIPYISGIFSMYFFYKISCKYLKNKFGERTLKICIDGHFTCPNRDGSVGKTGCIFCSERGSGEHIKCPNIADSIISIKSSTLPASSASANNFLDSLKLLFLRNRPSISCLILSTFTSWSLTLSTSLCLFSADLYSAPSSSYSRSVNF